MLSRIVRVRCSCSRTLASAQGPRRRQADGTRCQARGTLGRDRREGHRGVDRLDDPLGVHAQSVNLVLASTTGNRLDVVVALDGKPIPVNERGADVHVDSTGHTIVTVNASDMYRLVLRPGVEDHQLTVVAKQPGLEAYDFTFG